MVELLSCAEETIVHELATLDALQTIEHTNDVENDFYIFGEERHFLHYNQSDLKLYTYRADEFRPIRKYRKIKKEFTCFACIKNGKSLFAGGTESGKINFYNCLTPSLDVEKSFSSSVPNKVVDLDYSYCSKYLSAVYDDGRINVFGLQTSVKLNELPVDTRHFPMVARFFTSPNIKLAIGSYTGRFTVHDLVAKANIFEVTAAHKDLCCDIICPLSHSNLIISAGDCSINLYDIRKKKRTKAMEVLYPLSTISLSHCGLYLAAGDKFGEIACYDIRNMKLPMISKHIGRRPISRVAFVPPRNEAKTKMSAINDIEIYDSANSIEDRAVNENEYPDSFFDLGNTNPRISDLMMDSNYSIKFNRPSMDFDSMSLAGYKSRDILTEVSNHQADNLNSSFVTHRRKTNLRKSLANAMPVVDVIKEESETVEDFKSPKIPTTPMTINNQTTVLNAQELNQINSKLDALDIIGDIKEDIDELRIKVPELYVDLYSLTGVIMRTCSNLEMDPEFSTETKLQLVDYLGHGEQFQKSYNEMVEEKHQNSLCIEKILHPKMFQD